MKIFQRDLKKPATPLTNAERRAAYRRRLRRLNGDVRPQDLPSVSDDLDAPTGAGRACLAMLACWLAVGVAWWALS